jgi:hypothetical protein
MSDKILPMEHYTDADLSRIAARYEEFAAQARSLGKQAPDWDYIARVNPYVVVLRTDNASLRAENIALRARLAGKKEPGARQRAI